MGPRLLLCPPDHLDTHFLFNPWMDWDEEVDRDRAAAEWTALREVLASCGARIETIAPSPLAPAMCFTRDAVLEVDGEPLVLANDGPRADTEPILYAAWLRKRGWRPRWLPEGMRLDGGNVLRCSDGRRVVGIKPGANTAAASWLARHVRGRGGGACIGVPLANIRYLHLDMVLADLGGRGWLVHPPGFGEPDLSHPMWREILHDRPVIEVSSGEARDLACNVVVVDGTVVGGTLSDRLRAAIEALGLRCASTPLDEFRKAGGGAHCLTTELPSDGPTG